MAEIVELSIGNIITLRETEIRPTDETIVTELTGWDDGKAQILTVPKLFGAGSYVTEKHIPEREIVVNFFIVLADGLVREKKEELEAAMNTLTPLALKRTFVSETEKRTETISAFITGINRYRTFSDSAAELNLTFLANNPIKSVTTTPIATP
jgi:hypothetical protein